MEEKEMNPIVTSTSLDKKELFTLANETDLHDTKFETKPVSYLKDCMRRFVKNKASVVGGIIILLIALFAIFEPIIDSKNHVSNLDYPSGYQDAVFTNSLPKAFNGTGFWDGTHVVVIGSSDYNIYRYDDSNYERVEFIEEIKEKQSIGNRVTTKYKVRLDTYAVGTRVMNLSKDEYDKLVQYEKDHNLYQQEKSIMKPLINYSIYEDEFGNRGYLYHLQQDLLAEGLQENEVNNLIDRLSSHYNQNQGIYYKLRPEKNAKTGKYSDTIFVPVLGADGEPENIYQVDNEGNYVYGVMENSRYTVRVDYYDYFEYKNGFAPQFLLGTNQFGQDICLRLAKGARFSLLLGVGITVINFIIGLIYGAISGYYGGRVDLIMERFTDIISAIPTMIIMTIAQIQLTSNDSLKATLGAVGTIIAAILIAFVYNGWVGVASTTRMQFYRFKGQEYVLASRTLGAKDRRLIFKHILPNAAGTLVTSCVLMVPSVIFSESSLSYLGIIDFSSSGICSIGALLNEGQAAGISTYPHVLLFPAIVISLLMISFNLFGNGLRDAFNTTLRGSED